MADVKEMISALGLTDEIHWDIALYVLFFLNLILMSLQSGSSAFGALLSIVILVSIVLDKTRAFGYMLDPGPYGPTRCHEEIFLGTYLIRVAMFALPLTIAGMTKNGKARGLGILTGIAGGAYMFIRWYMEQRDVTTKDLTCAYLFTTFALQNVGVILVIARLYWRENLHLGTVYRDIPVTVTRDLAAHDVEVEIA